MRMMASFFSAYPGRTVVMLLALLLSGVAEGIGVEAAPDRHVPAAGRRRLAQCLEVAGRHR